MIGEYMIGNTKEYKLDKDDLIPFNIPGKRNPLQYAIFDQRMNYIGLSGTHDKGFFKALEKGENNPLVIDTNSLHVLVILECNNLVKKAISKK